MEDRIFIAKEVYSAKLQFMDFIDEFEGLSEVERKILLESVNGVIGNKLNTLLAAIKEYL